MNELASQATSFLVLRKTQLGGIRKYWDFIKISNNSDAVTSFDNGFKHILYIRPTLRLSIDSDLVLFGGLLFKLSRIEKNFLHCLLQLL